MLCWSDCMRPYLLLAKPAVYAPGQLTVTRTWQQHTMSLHWPLVLAHLMLLAAGVFCAA